MTEFATLLSAVKPKERSDQYRILAALYYLRAHIEPISIKNVTDLLKLHCGNKMPSNINASLRAYTGFVEPSANGSLRLWSLTTKGLARLRTLSGLTLTTELDNRAFEIDVGIICALEHPELAAVIWRTNVGRNWKCTICACLSGNQTRNKVGGETEGGCYYRYFNGPHSCGHRHNATNIAV